VSPMGASEANSGTRNYKYGTVLGCEGTRYYVQVRARDKVFAQVFKKFVARSSLETICCLIRAISFSGACVPQTKKFSHTLLCDLTNF